MMLQRQSLRAAGTEVLLRPVAVFMPVIALMMSHVASADEAPVERQAVIVVVGAEGTAEYGQQFQLWADRWEDAVRKGAADFRRIGSPSPSAVTPDSDLTQLTNAVQELGNRQTAEPLWIVLIGHGTFDSRTATFNLNGPDIDAQAMVQLCSNCQRPLAIINCSSCSAPFLNALSGDNRVVVTATKDGNQIQYSRFGDAMSQAIGDAAADIDRDGQTSLLEAWLYASRRTAEFYSEEGRLATEHALLDDNGDALGTRAELFEGYRPKAGIKEPGRIDGSQASRWHLIRSPEEQLLTTAEREQRDDLERKLEALRSRRADFSEEAYLNELEPLAVALAEIYRAVEQRDASATP
ncbi:MAG: hypothetical protein KDA96_03995 [Planctomycetaceae bacterium]|nr:hypothetical protein [Planctomycetaceae bacterium]